MVLSAPAVDPGAAEARAWLGRLIGLLERSRRGVLVALVNAVPTQLGPVVRALAQGLPWGEGGLEVCLHASELLRVPHGSRVLLRVVPEELDWLNLHRPIFADRELRAILWADEVASARLVREAVDLFDWVSLMVEVPPREVPGFAVERLRGALAAGMECAWEGPELDAALDAAGWSGSVVEISATRSYHDLIQQLSTPGLPVVAGIMSERDAWRVRLALAQVGREGAWVARDPGVQIADIRRLYLRQVDWEQAARQLSAAGWARAAFVAAWLELDPERLEFARPGIALGPHIEVKTGVDGVAEANLVRELRALGGGVPDEGLVAKAEAAGFEDVAMELMRERASRGVGVDAGRLAQWLIVTGEGEEAMKLAREWLVRSVAALDELNVMAASIKLGDLAVKAGDGAGGHRYYEEALDALRRWGVQGHDGPQLKHNLAVVYKKIGAVLARQGHRNIALRYYEDSLALRKELVVHSPLDWDRQRALADSYDDIGGVLLAREDLVGARRYFEDALGIARALVERDHGQTEANYNLAYCSERVGDVLRAQGDLVGARRHYEESLLLYRALADGAPGRTDLQSCLSGVYKDLGDMLRAEGDRSGALRYYRDSLALLSALADREPGRADLQSKLSHAYDRVGAMLFEQGDAVDARRHYDRSLAIARRLAEREPERATLKNDLCVSYMQVGDALLAQGDATSALRYYDDSLSLAKLLAEQEPEDMKLQHSVCVAYAKVGTSLLVQGDVAGARSCFEDFMVVARAQAERNPGDLQAQVILATSYRSMATVDAEAAFEWLDRAVTLLRRVHGADPSRVDAARDLAFLLVNSLEYDAGPDPAAAVAARSEGLEILCELDRRGMLDARFQGLLRQLGDESDA